MNITKPLFILALTLFTASTAFGNSQVWNLPGSEGAEKAFKIIQYLDHKDGSKVVVLDAGKKDGIINGSVFKTFRASIPSGAATPDPVWVATGKIKAIDVQNTYTIANVTEQGSSTSKVIFKKFSGVMAGDLAMAPHISLTRSQVVTPSLAISYFDIFEDPTSQPMSFELSAKGMGEIEEAAKPFRNAHLSLLMIEGYTDAAGPTSVNQVESYQRALTVRQYLIDELGFDPKRVVAFGFGESELADESQTPGHVRVNRRIVLKAVPVSDQASY